MPISTTGLTALVGGEDWHYVGETDEPAFSTGVSSSASGETRLAFRIREAAVVDIQGNVSVSPAASNQTLFTLPAEYRPASGTGVVAPAAVIDSATGLYIAAVMVISTAGNVSLVTQTSTFVGGWVYGQFFLEPPEVNP